MKTLYEWSAVLAIPVNASCMLSLFRRRSAVRLLPRHGGGIHVSTVRRKDADADDPSVRVLLTADEVQALPPLAAQQRHVKVPVQDTGEVRLLDLFVVRDADGVLRGFENYCPHAGGPLNMFPDRFFSRDGRSLICTRHGAKFDPVDGACIHGPCKGTMLHPVQVDLVPSTGAVCATVEELESVCVDGFGAFMLFDADTPEARGPAVVRPEPPPPPTPRARRKSPK